ncbi:hypothetical protein IJ768_01115 [Candidatus Saccharibacteria bacterium]|nr:hypothetical protein [Candidatus Saccharibacteria bacterium]
MKRFSYKRTVAPTVAALAVTAGLFCPLTSVHADSFDGKAYLIWDCGEETPCYHLFEDINTDNTYTIYSDTDIEADNHAEKTFSAVNVDVDNTTFALKTAYDTYKAANPDHTMQDVMEYEDGEHNRLALNPMNAPREANAYTHFGDWNFKVLIKSADYAGASIKNATDGYEPDFGAALNSVLYHDVSGTTKANPATLYVIPQQTEIILSGEAGAFDSVAAVDLENAGAVTVTSVAGGHKITFNSAYYDRVIFKVTKGTKTYYIRIFRTAVQEPFPAIETNQKVITALVYFDEGKTCADYEVSAKLDYKNGTQKTIKMGAATSFEDPFDPSIIVNSCYESGGEGLRKGHYTYTADVNLSNLNGIYFTVSKAGSTSTTYAGTLSGSKKGIYLDLSTSGKYSRKINPDKN